MAGRAGRLKLFYLCVVLLVIKVIGASGVFLSVIVKAVCCVFVLSLLTVLAPLCDSVRGHQLF